GQQAVRDEAYPSLRVLVARHRRPPQPRTGVRLLRDVLRLGEIAAQRIHVVHHASDAGRVEVIEVARTVGHAHTTYTPLRARRLHVPILLRPRLELDELEWIVDR